MQQIPFRVKWFSRVFGIIKSRSYGFRYSERSNEKLIEIVQTLLKDLEVKRSLTNYEKFLANYKTCLLLKSFEAIYAQFSCFHFEDTVILIGQGNVRT